MAIPLIKESSASKRKPEELICPLPEQSYISENCLFVDSYAVSQVKNLVGTNPREASIL